MSRTVRRLKEWTILVHLYDLGVERFGRIPSFLSFLERREQRV